MKNMVVQERLFTEPKDNPEEATKFAIAFEQGTQQKKTICIKPTNIKGTSVCRRKEQRMLQMWRKAVLHGSSKDLPSKERPMQKLWKNRTLRPNVSHETSRDQNKQGTTSEKNQRRSKNFSWSS